MRRLAELGVTLALTENDATNAPMLAINERLGFVKQPAWIDLLKVCGVE